MKKLIFLILLSISINAQSWNSIITTSIDISNADYLENYADKDGIHVVTYDDYTDDIKYYLISSSGDSIRSSTISTNGEFPNIVGNDNTLYIVYREGSNIRVKKSTNAGASWTNKTDLGIGTYVCGGVDAAINDDGIHTVWAIENSSSETNYKKYRPTNDDWVDFYNVTNYTNGYGTTPTVSLSPSRIHVGYNSNTYYDPPYFAFDGNEMSRTKYNTTWQTQQQLATNESGRGIIFATSSKLYDFYYDIVADMGAHSDLYFKNRTIGYTSWSSSTLLEGYSDVTHPLVICETANGYLHTYTASGVVKERIIISDSVNSTSEISSNASIYSLGVNSVYNDIYVSWRDGDSDYMRLRQYDADPQAPQNLQLTEGGVYGHTPVLTWDANIEPDINNYRIYKKYNSGSWNYIATTSNTTYTDTDEVINLYGAPGWDVYYKIKATDVQNNLSVYSDEVTIEIVPPMFKRTEELAESKEILRETKLFSNYPNPFNPTTQISYQIPKNGFVNLVVYNALGQEVAELVNQNQSIGKYSVQFNANNLPSGVYIYKLHAGEFSSVKKMVLTK